MKSKRTPKNDLETIIPLLIGVWRRYRKIPGLEGALQTREFRGVVAAVKEMVDGLENGKTLACQDYFAKPELLGAYLLYQWVIHYLQGMTLLNELPTTPNRVLDLCSGPAPFAFAALRHGFGEVYAVDRNAQALELGAEIAGRYGMALNVRKWDCQKASSPVEGTFDLIIVGHGLEELFPEGKEGFEKKQKNFIDFLLTRLSPEGYLLLVESSQPATNKRLLKLRDELVQQGVPVQAPCVWQGACPALQTKNSPCYAQRELEKPELIKQIQRAASINLSSLKMSYVIFRSPKAEWPKLPEKPLYRVISPPFDSYQGKRFYLCGTDGKKSLGSHLQEHPKDSRAFDYLRRGDLISVEGALLQGNALDIVQETKVYLEKAAGQAIADE